MIRRAYIDKGQNQQGAGTQDKNKNKPTGETTTVDSYSPAPDVKTQDALIQDLKKSGFLKGTEDFSTLFKKYKEGLPLK
jgi:hypothetical protein